MKFKFHHPLWVHLPAFILLAIIVGVMISARPMLDLQVPIHFGPTGIPDKFGTAWEAAITILISALMFIGASIAVDEDWARREPCKAFNWLSLIDELAVGTLAAVTLGYFDMMRQHTNLLVFPWLYFALCTGGGLLLAAFLEWKRPWNPAEEAGGDEISVLVEDVHERIATGQRWAYAETQNPGWMKVVVLGAGTLCIAGAIDSWATSPTLAYVYIAASIAIFSLWGGLYVDVTAERIAVKIGLLGIPLFRAKPQDIADVAVHSFSPLRDFGGWGIRFNREMLAFFLRGNKGVKLRTVKEKQFLIGSDTPERLAAVIQAATGQQQAAGEREVSASSAIQ